MCNFILASSAHFVSCVMVWAAYVEVAGSSPSGGILAQMCECVISLSVRLRVLCLLVVRFRVLFLLLVRLRVLFLVLVRVLVLVLLLVRLRALPRFSQNFRKILGNPWVSKMSPF